MLDVIISVLTLKTVLVGLLTGYAVYWIIQKVKYKLPPGPFALPIVGNMMQLKTDMLHEEIYEMSKKYGPILKIYLGPVMVIAVNNIEAATEVLIKKGPEFANRQSTPSLDASTYGGKDIIFGQYGLTWKLHRKIASKALRHYMQGEALEERIHNAVSVAFDEIRKEDKPFDPEVYVNFIVSSLLLGLCYGGKYEYTDPELNGILKLDDIFIEAFSDGGPIEDRFPGLKYFWESKKMRMVKWCTNEAQEKILVKKYKEHVDSFDKENIRDFADTLILARQEAEEDPEETDLDKLTDEHIIQTLSDIFFAGTATSRFSLRYAILHMAAYPDIQAKVQEEIDRVVGPDKLPGMQHRPMLGYTEAVLHESMRLASVAPTGVLHKATCDTSVGGYDVPKNTLVMINHWALHHDPSVWKDVDDFRPERFLDAEGKLGPKPENWLPFGAGRRVCLGESVAKPQLHLLFACLMQRFTWRLPDGTTADLSPAGNFISLSPKPHKLVVQQRGHK